MKYRAAVFDLDGTLLDTLDDLADSMNAVLVAFGMLAHPVRAYRFFVGDGMLNLVRRAATREISDETAAEMAEAMAREYSGNWANKTRPYDGVRELLDVLKERGMKLGILSNKPDSFTRIMVEHYFAGVFDAVFGAREGVPRKPDPGAALEIAALLGVAPGETLYFGDSDTDMKTGRSAGMRTIGVTWGFRPVGELIYAGAEAVIDKPGDALALPDLGERDG